jgi:hypothetical protein
MRGLIFYWLRLGLLQALNTGIQWLQEITLAKPNAGVAMGPKLFINFFVMEF